MSDCRHLKPKICGNKLKPFLSDKGCGVPRFVGIEDVTINQGIGIDLTEGVYAYDGNGNEIPYTVTPDSIDMCDVGEHTVIYRAMAEGRKFAPWFCSKQRGLAGGLLCNRVALRKDRTVTIEQIDPPRIEGLDTVKISPNVEFDPTEGVTAIDGNGNEIEYTYSGPVDAVAEGAIASFETEFEQNAKSVLVNIEPIQSGSGTPSPDNICPISGHTECVTSVVGKNLIDFPNCEVKSVEAINNTYSPLWAEFDGTYEENTQYTFSCDVHTADTTKAWGITAVYTDGTQSYYWIHQSATNVHSVTTAANKTINKIRFAYNSVHQLGFSNAMLELGSTATSYEPYQGTTHTTTLGRTVYGGTLDLVSGVLTVDRRYVVLDGVNNRVTGSYGNASQRLIGYSISSDPAVGVSSDSLLCSNLEVSNSILTTENAIALGDGNTKIIPHIQGMQGIGGTYATDADLANAVNAWLAENPSTCVYKLATPQTYQLTPTEIELLEGQNNVWSDSGDVRVVYQESMPIGESIEYDTVGERIITYTATDICGNTSEVEREILVGITAQACKSQACGAFVYCAPTEACEAIVGLSATACE